MFIKSITLCRFKSVTGVQTKNLTHLTKSTDVNNTFINLLGNSDFIDGFSFIFDPNYAKMPSELVSSEGEGESYVEITIWRSKDEISQIYSWLNAKKDIKFRRSPQNPKTIYINNKKHSIVTFHDSLLNLGIENINSIHMHRFLSDEMHKLDFLTGEDLWNMLMKVIECEELIEMAERKEGVMKKEALKEKYNMFADIVTYTLPKKFQLRDAINERVRLHRHFFTLYHIIFSRQLDIFEKYKETYETQQMRLRESLDNQQNNREMCRMEKREELEAMIVNRTYLREVKNIYDDLTFHCSKHTREDKLTFQEVFEMINSCNLAETSDKENTVDSWVKAWKNSMKYSSENLDKSIKRIKVLADTANHVTEYITANEKPNPTDLESIGNKSTELITITVKKILNARKNADENMTKAHKLAVQASLDMSIPETLFEVERLIQSKESFKEDCLGPVFKYFKPSVVGLNIWPFIRDISTFLLFRKSSTAETFVDEFRAKIRKNRSDQLAVVPNYRFKIISLDAISNGVDFDDSLVNKKLFESLKALIPNEVPASIRKVLKSLFCQFLITKGKRENNDELLKNFKIIEFDDRVSIARHKTYAKVICRNKDNQNEEEQDTIAILQKMYDFIIHRARFCLIVEKNMEIKNEIDKAKHKKLEVCLRKLLDSNFSIKKKVTTPSEFDVLEKFVAESNFVNEITSWNIADIRIKSLIKFDCKQEKKWANVKDEICDLLVDQISRISFSMSDASYKMFTGKCKDLQEELQSESKNLNVYRIERSSNFVSSPFVEGLEAFVNNAFSIEKIETKKKMMLKLINALNKKLDITHERPFFFHQDFYNTRKDENSDEIFEELINLRRELMRLSKEKIINVHKLNESDYKKLIESIGSVQKFANEDDFVPVHVRKRAYPLMNVIVVKILKDTINHFITTYNYVLEDFITDSNLFFFTNPNDPEPASKDLSFSWNCLDLTRLKAIEFIEMWKSEEMKYSVALELRQRIKGLLLVFYIINYISAFKFVILSEKIFEDFPENIRQKFNELLEAISPYVQIIIEKNKSCTVDETNESQVVHETESMEMDQDESSIITG